MSFFIEANGTIYELTATTTVSYNQTAKATSHPVQSGGSVSDHVTQESDTIQFDGVASNVSFNETTMDLKTFLTGLQALKRAGKTFNVTFSDSYDVMTNCVLEGISDVVAAGSGTAHQMSLAIRQVRKGSRGKKVDSPVRAENFEKKAQEQQKTGGNQQELETLDWADEGLIQKTGDPNAREKKFANYKSVK